jgi:hypothetical protein
MEKFTFVVGESITATISVTNTTDITIKSPDLKTPYYNYRFTVIQSPNRLVTRTAKARKLEEGLGDASATTVVLSPGGCLVDKVDLTELFEIREPGTYYVTATRLRMRTAEGKFADVLSGNALIHIRNNGGGSALAVLPATPGLGLASSELETTRSVVENGTAPKQTKWPKAALPEQGELLTTGTAVSNPGFMPARRQPDNSAPGTKSLPLMATTADRSGAGKSWILIALLLGSLGVLAFVLFRAAGRPKA